MLSENDHIDSYMVVMKDDKIQMLIKQSTSPCPIKYIAGYGVPTDGSMKK